MEIRFSSTIFFPILSFSTKPFTSTTHSAWPLNSPRYATLLNSTISSLFAHLLLTHSSLELRLLNSPRYATLLNCTISSLFAHLLLTHSSLELMRKERRNEIGRAHV